MLRVDLSKRSDERLQLLLTACFFAKVRCRLGQPIPQTIGIDFCSATRGASLIMPQTIFGPLPLDIIETSLHLLHLGDSIGMLQAQCRTDDMFLCKGLLGLMSHVGDDTFLLLEVMVHLPSLVHGLMEGLCFSDNCVAELRDD